MAKPLVIEKLRLQEVVARCVSEGKNPMQIAEECSRIAKHPVNHMAVRRYLEVRAKLDAPPHQKKAAIVRKPERVEMIVNRDIDIIELTYKTTEALNRKFDWVVDLPDLFDRRMLQIEERLIKDAKDIDADFLARWRIAFVDDLRRNVHNVAILNRELRENTKFMADLREKAFDFKLWKEFVDIFIEIFREEDAAACDRAMSRISDNPRMQRIIEQQFSGTAAG